jgi:hypothetical protein
LGLVINGSNLTAVALRGCDARLCGMCNSFRLLQQFLRKDSWPDRQCYSQMPAPQHSTRDLRGAGCFELPKNPPCSALRSSRTENCSFDRKISRLVSEGGVPIARDERDDSNTAGNTRGSMPFARRTSLEISAVFNPAHYDSIPLLKLLPSLCRRSVLLG